MARVPTHLLMGLPKKEVVLIPADRIVFSNDRPNREVVRQIEQHFDDKKFTPVCAHLTKDGYLLTDGNHRAEALIWLGATHIPGILLNKQEFGRVEYGRGHIDFAAFVPPKMRTVV